MPSIPGILFDAARLIALTAVVLFFAIPLGLIPAMTVAGFTDPALKGFPLPPLMVAWIFWVLIAGLWFRHGVHPIVSLPETHLTPLQGLLRFRRPARVLLLLEGAVVVAGTLLYLHAPGGRALPLIAGGAIEFAGTLAIRPLYRATWWMR